MSHVQTFRGPDPGPAGQGLVHVPEDRVPRLSDLNRLEQGHAAPLQAPGRGVVEKFGDGRRDMGAQDIHLAHRLDLRPELVLAHLVRRAVDRRQAAADETERPSAEFHRAAVQHMMSGLQVLLPHSRDIDVAVGQVGGFRERGEHRVVLPGHVRLEKGTPSLGRIPATATPADAVFPRAAEQPQAAVIRRPSPAGSFQSWQDVTAAQFSGEVVAVAKGLVAAGIEAGDRVALMSHTRYEWTLIDYAIWVAGAVTVPVYETSSAEQAEWILADSGVRACFVETAAYEQVIDSLRDQVPALKHVWRIEAGGAAALAALTEGGTSVSDEIITERAATAKASDVATVIYTSGTTGRPKGCELTHENLLADVRNAFIGPLAVVAGSQNPGTLLFLPLAHVFARVIEVGCIEGGIVLGHCGDLNALLPALASFQPTFVLAVPRVFEKVYNGAEQRAASEKKGAIFGRAARVAIAYSRAMDTPGRPTLAVRAQHALLDRLVYSKLRAALGGRAQYAVSGGAGVPVLQGYGLTETTAAATINRPDRNKIGTVGQPLPGVAVKIADDGELLISGAR